MDYESAYLQAVWSWPSVIYGRLLFRGSSNQNKNESERANAREATRNEVTFWANHQAAAIYLLLLVWPPSISRHGGEKRAIIVGVV